MNAIDVVCPKCKAASGAECTEPQIYGANWVNYFHKERTLQAVKNDTKCTQFGVFEIITKSVYVSGPITGIPNHNKDAFASATKQLREDGFFVVNPHGLTIDQNGEWSWYMRRDIFEMCRCESIFMLKGWEHSKGANIEHDLALNFGMKIMVQE